MTSIATLSFFVVFVPVMFFLYVGLAGAIARFW